MRHSCAPCCGCAGTGAGAVAGASTLPPGMKDTSCRIRISAAGVDTGPPCPARAPCGGGCCTHGTRRGDAAGRAQGTRGEMGETAAARSAMTAQRTMLAHPPPQPQALERLFLTFSRADSRTPAPSPPPLAEPRPAAPYCRRLFGPSAAPRPPPPRAKEFEQGARIVVRINPRRPAPTRATPKHAPWLRRTAAKFPHGRRADTSRAQYAASWANRRASDSDIVDSDIDRHPSGGTLVAAVRRLLGESPRQRTLLYSGVSSPQKSAGGRGSAGGRQPMMPAGRERDGREREGGREEEKERRI